MHGAVKFIGALIVIYKLFDTVLCILFLFLIKLTYSKTFFVLSKSHVLSVKHK